MIKSNQSNLLSDNLEEIITQAFVNANDNLLKNPQINTTLSGTTCVSVIYTPEKLIIANVGDSRCVLGRVGPGGAFVHENLSRDHKPTIAEEAKRILQKGGRIRPMKDGEGNFVGPLRVYMKDKDIPGLAMTRSFGDYYASIAGTVPIPEIREYYYREDDKVLVLASDGLFEFISSEEVVTLIQPFYETSDIVGCCEYLYKEATRRWLKEEGDAVDDITIIVVFFE